MQPSQTETLAAAAASKYPLQLAARALTAFMMGHCSGQNDGISAAMTAAYVSVLKATYANSGKTAIAALVGEEECQ